MHKSRKNANIVIIIKGKRMRKLFLCIILLFSIQYTINAQELRIIGYSKTKNPVLGKSKAKTSKHSAIIDLYTNEKGFSFTIGTTPVEAQQGDEFITLTLPHKTSHFTIKHPEYGQYTWKVPSDVLKKKHHYKATIFTDSPTKEFKITKQWAVLNIQPSRAIVTIDSTLIRTSTGEIQVYLPIGKHIINIQSPFHNSYTGEFELTDSIRYEQKFYLEPIYSYLTVSIPLKDAEIYLNKELLGRENVSSSKLLPGKYELTVKKGKSIIYREEITLETAERKHVDIASVADYSSNNAYKSYDSLNLKGAQIDSLQIKAFDADTQIWVNREKVANGSWSQMVPEGFYAISTRKGDKESATQYVYVGDGTKNKYSLASPSNNYGWINISCNIIDANVYLNNKYVGKTPCIIESLPIDKTYIVKVVKQGYSSVHKEIKLKGNDIVNVSLELKKVKNGK